MATYDPATALAVVDVQNDFADPGGSLYVSGGEEVVPAVNAEIESALTAGALVVYTQDWHPPSTPHFAKDGGVWPVHCVRETRGAAFHPDLVVAAGAPVVRKGAGGEDGYSGFTVADPATGDRSSTELAGILRDRGISRLVIAGLATDYCVKDTAIDGTTLGFTTVVLAGVTRAVDLSPGDGDRALESMAAAGVAIG
jgi:nicotinamidase/pyrazinamidase